LKRAFWGGALILLCIIFVATLLNQINATVSAPELTQVDMPAEAEPSYRDERIPEADEALSAGQLTIFNESVNAFGQPVPGLNRMDGLFFFVGNSFFNQNWVTAPSSTAARDGLGPHFVARSCSGCHLRDGRGRPPVVDGEKATGFLVQLSIPGVDALGAPLAEPSYGRQFQDSAIQNVATEGRVQISYTESEGSFADGERYTLRTPTVELIDLAYGPLAETVQLSPRVGSQIIGLGLLEAISEETLLANADPDDLDGDGISGRPNYVWDLLAEEAAIGRFGWKANQPNLIQQVASAFSADMGITTELFPLPDCTSVQAKCLAAPHGGDPEIDEDDLQKVVLYTSTLAVPARRNWQDQEVLHGKQIFSDVGCASCHLPSITTGEHPRFAELSNQTIRPYTDLLLHDMGPGLADDRPHFEASGSEWRTPPLWGIGLIEPINKHTYFLHDGRARSLLEAILWHGGEAESSKDAVLELDKAERNALIKFLESL